MYELRVSLTTTNLEKRLSFAVKGKGNVSR